MKYKPYPFYKDSGVEWLGKIPEEWILKPLFTVLPEHYVQNAGMISDEVLSLSYGAIVLKDVSDNFGLLPESFETYQLVSPNDIVLRLTDLQNDQRSLRTAISSLSGIITSAYTKLRCLQNASFFHWLLHSADTQKVFYGLGGGVRQSMKFADLKRFQLVVPPLPTQKAITVFLDTETARIDSLINDYVVLITLLQEKRQALISHAVTRGLSELVSLDDPDFGEWARPVKFKDSGVEWLGEIPEGWEVKKLKYTGNIINGYAFDSRDFTSCGIRVIKISNIQPMFIDWSDESYVKEEHYDLLPEYRLYKGDFVFALTRPIISAGIKVALIDSDEKLLINQRNAVFRPTTISTSFSYYVFNNSLMVDEYNFLIDKTGQQPNISTNEIKNITITLPTLSTQQAIAAFLDKQTAKMDTLITEAQSAIELLKEHRSALITNAVTGKINVEGLV
jgi:type I restriction enzyme S subunit